MFDFVNTTLLHDCCKIDVNCNLNMISLFQNGKATSAHVIFINNNYFLKVVCYLCTYTCICNTNINANIKIININVHVKNILIVKKKMKDSFILIII